MISFFSPSVTSLSVSSHQIYFSRHLMIGIIRFLCKHCDGSTIYLFSKFRPPNFCSTSYGRKNFSLNLVMGSTFRFFLKGKGYISKSCLDNKLGNANVFALIDGTPFSWTACCDIFVKKNLSQFSSKKSEIFRIFQTDVTFPIAHFVS